MGGGVIPLGVWLDPEGDLGADNTATRDSTLHSDQSGMPLDPGVSGTIRELEQLVNFAPTLAAASLFVFSHRNLYLKIIVNVVE